MEEDMAEEDMVDMGALEVEGPVVALVEALEEDREGAGNDRKTES